MLDRFKVKIIKRVIETSDVVTVFFELPFEYHAGQYITAYFDETGDKAGRAYSLSSYPGDKLASITVKKVGVFSNKIHNLEVGDFIDISSAYGFLMANNDRPVLAITGGVGIAPIWSIIRQTLQSDKNRQVMLINSDKTTADIIFKDKITALQSKYTNFTVKQFLTRDDSEGSINRRVDIAQDLPADYKDMQIYICGPVDFVKFIWGQLKTKGVSDDQVATESFFTEIF